MTSRNNSSDARPICQNLLEKGYIVETTKVETDVGKALFDESETYRTATTGEMADIRMAEDYREDDTVVSNIMRIRFVVRYGKETVVQTNKRIDPLSGKCY